MYACMYECVYVCMYECVCMYVFTYVCMYEWMYVQLPLIESVLRVNTQTVLIKGHKHTTWLFVHTLISSAAHIKADQSENLLPGF